MSDKLRLMLVDDDPDIQNLLKTFFEDEFEISVASNGLDGLSKLVEEAPDLMIVDLMMPIIDGFEFVKKARQIPYFENTPIFLLSALSDPKSIKEGYKSGSDYYLRKPFDYNRTIKIIHQEITNQNIVPNSKEDAVKKIEEGYQTPSEAGEDSDSIKILVISDQVEVQDLMEASLGQEYKIVKAWDAVGFMNEAILEDVDIFIMEGYMPHASSLDMVRTIKDTEKYSDAPVLILKQGNLSGEDYLTKQMNVTGIIEKPISESDLMQVVRKCVISLEDEKKSHLYQEKTEENLADQDEKIPSKEESEGDYFENLI